LDELGDSDPELSAAVADFRAEELEHKEAALAAGAESAPGYPLLSFAIRAGCRAAIALSKRICYRNRLPVHDGCRHAVPFRTK
ncbi:MAG: demethoxyubiquinone hydroxylase family protein, partial [Sphingopyxis sp.]